ncbi:MAG: putative porin, partial [Planctomycetes bacterium]|nr:putative porin [Planctomycetota bacterium]
MRWLHMAGIVRATTVRLSCALIVWLVVFACPVRGATQQEKDEQVEESSEQEQSEEETDTRQVKLEALDRLNAVLQTEANLSAEFKEAFSELIRALRQEAAENSLLNEREQLKQELLATLAEENAERDRVLGAVGDVFEKLDLYGDVRLRHETDNNVDRRPTRNRERFRLRLGAIYRIADELDFEARLITGNATDPKSSHQNFGTGFESFDVTLDRINVTYRPEWLPDLWVTAGKFAHPFRVNPVYGELVWDSDVQPEGITAGYSFTNEKMKIFDRLDLTVGEYLILQQNELDEASVFVAQV